MASGLPAGAQSFSLVIEVSPRTERKSTIMSQFVDRMICAAQLDPLAYAEVEV